MTTEYRIIVRSDYPYVDQILSKHADDIAGTLEDSTDGMFTVEIVEVVGEAGERSLGAWVG